MANFFTDNDDLRWYFEKGIDWAPLVELTEYGFTQEDGFGNTAEALDFYRDVLEMVGHFVADEIAPHAADIDRQGVTLEDGEVSLGEAAQGIFEQIKALELHKMCLPRELGGMNVPTLLYHFNGEMFARADVSTMTHHGFHGGMALALLLYSVIEGSTEYDAVARKLVKTRWEGPVREIMAGEAWASMDLTEPDAGSDLAAIRTHAEQDAEGRWLITGQKIFITSGHAKYHFVLARTEASKDPTDPLSGLAGLSMFLVQAYDEVDGEKRWFATIDRVEEKIGHHGSPTCSVLFEKTPGELIGERGDGFKLMLLLMNNARVGVAFESIGLCEAAYRLAKQYAEERPSMGKSIDRHELIADYLDEMRTDIQVLRALAVHGGYHEELSQRYRLAARYFGDDELERKRYERLAKEHGWKARRVTPLGKYWAAEKAVEHGRRCIQIHGGVGYTREYGAEKLLRDALVMPIYEGTSQIQALMAMKDTLGQIIKNPQAFVARVAQARWRSVSARDPLEKRVARLQSISLAAQQQLIQRTAADKLKGLGGRPVNEWPRAFLQNWDPKRDFSFALLHAENLIRILCDEAGAVLLWQQARRHPERRELLNRHLERAEPRARYLLDRITTTGDRLLDRLATEEEARETG